MTLTQICVFIMALSWFLTGLMRRYALRTNLLDIPNERSSHVLPTPRGGGLSFVACFLFSLIILLKQHLISNNEFYIFMGPGVIVALLGFLDDKYHLSAKWRLVGHVMMAALAVYLLSQFSAIPVFYGNIWLINAGRIAAIIYLVWLLNLFNFMDGIDGLAAAEAICICCGGAVLYFLQDNAAMMSLPLLLAVAVFGFLLWNFPPARIFMGDVGSGFLGFVIGILSLQAAMETMLLFWCWLIMLAVFITDASLTLIRRYLGGQPVFEAHRSHAYQQAVSQCGKHWPVTVSIILINLFWLFPVALLVEQKMISWIFGLLMAYLPLILLAFKFKAGKS